MIIIQGWLRLAEGEIEKLRSAAATMIHTTRTTEPGCIEYNFAVDLVEVGDRCDGADLVPAPELWSTLSNER